MATAPHTRRSGGTPFALKTDLQRQRDKYGFKISKYWLPRGARPHQNPRSIALPASGHRARCFQNVVHQSLMHTPVFINWILSHTRTDGHVANDCVMCLYKAFTQRYWNDAANANQIFLANDASLDRIAVLARNANASFIGPGDAGEFYQWVTDQMVYQIPVVTPLFRPDDLARWKLAHWREMNWNEESRALFQLDYAEEARCQSCHNIVNNNASRNALDMSFDPATMTNLGQMLEAAFFMETAQLYCAHPFCTRVTNQVVRREITAAPQVLRIFVSLTTSIGGAGVKQLHPWDIPGILDLTRNQENAALPLAYTLSSAIAHGGSGGNMELGGIVMEPEAPNEEEEDANSDHGSRDSREPPSGDLVLEHRLLQAANDRATALLQAEEDADNHQGSGDYLEPPPSDMEFLQADGNALDEDEVLPGDEELAENEEDPMEGWENEANHPFWTQGQEYIIPPWVDGPADVPVGFHPHPLGVDDAIDEEDDLDYYNEANNADELLQEFIQEEADAIREGRIETPEARYPRSRQRTGAGMPRLSRTPEDRRDPRRHMGAFHGLVEVTREEYIQELGPDLSDLPDAPETPERDNKGKGALHRGDGSSSPTEPPTRSDGAGGNCLSGNASNPQSMANHSDDMPGPAAIGPDHDPDVANWGWSRSLRQPITGSGRVIQAGPRYWTMDTAPQNFGTHIVNVRGPQSNSHVGSGALAGEIPHVVQLNPGELEANPQRPGHDCYRPTGFQVLVLTYTRNKLSGKEGKLERDIPQW